MLVIGHLQPAGIVNSLLARTLFHVLLLYEFSISWITEVVK